MGVYVQQKDGKRPILLIYGGLFALVYIALMVLMNLLTFGFGLDFGVLGGLVTVVGAAFLTGLRFARREGRSLEKQEHRQLSTVSLIFAMLLSFAMSFIVLPKLTAAGNPFAAFEGAFTSIVWIVITLLVAAINFVLIHYFLGFGSVKARPASDKA